VATNPTRRGSVRRLDAFELDAPQSVVTERTAGAEAMQWHPTAEASDMT
jgi:hypothetical protein